MRNVTPEQVAMAEQHRRGELPDRIEGALGELAGAAKEGLMALSVGVGLGVLHALMAAEVDEVVGPKGKHDRDRSAKRHGHEQTSVCLGARRVPVSRPRVRTADDSEEVTLETFSHFADRDPLADVVLESPATKGTHCRTNQIREPDPVDRRSIRSGSRAIWIADGRTGSRA